MNNYNEDVAWGIVDDCNFVIDRDNENNIYAEYTDHNKQPCCANMKSEQFKTYLRQEYRRRTNDRNAPTFTKELEAKEDEARENPDSRVQFYRRVAGSIREGFIYYSLYDGTSRVVKVEDGQWRILKSTQNVRFLNLPAAKPQVNPVKGGNLLELLKPYFNFLHDIFILLVVCLVHCFSQGSDHFVIIISGPKGTGKSTATDVLREILDPSQINKNLTPKSVSDLMVNLSNNYIISIDNSGKLTEEMSNTLCAAVTGAAASKRRLYTDTDEVFMHFRSVVVVNGIGIIPEKSDLADRSLLFETQKISTKNRIPESELMQRFQEDKAEILGAIFDTLEKAIQLYPSVNTTELHRMADANKEMIAIAMALGIEQDEFQRILDANAQAMQKAYAGSNEFVDFVSDYVIRYGKQEGPVSEVYKKMYRHMVGNKKFFPGSPSAFSRKISEEKDALRNNGIRFSKSKKADANCILIERIPHSQQTKAQKERTKQLASTDE